MIPNALAELAAGSPVRNWLVLGPFAVDRDGWLARQRRERRRHRSEG